MGERADEKEALTQDDRITLISALAEARERGILPIYEAVERIVAERLAIIPAQRQAFISSPSLDPAWIAGWHAAIDHATYMSTRPGKTGGDDA